AGDRRAGSGCESAAPHGLAAQLVGAGARVRLHRLRRPASRLGAPQDRLLGASAGVDRPVPHRHRPGNPVAGDARGAGQEIPGKGSALTLGHAYLKSAMKPKSMCTCWWQWNSVEPGLSATKSISSSWKPPNITTSFITPAVAFPPTRVNSKLWR